MRMRTKLLALLVTAAMGLAWLPEASASRGEIRARCDGNKPVILQRPAGTENVQVVCRNGVPDFMITPTPVFKYDPVTQQLPLATPPDFGGWVTVRLNGKLLKTPFDPKRGIQEPGAYVAASTGRVMMPVRFFTEAFGGEVNWFQDQQRIQLLLRGRSQVINLWLGGKQAMVGLQQVQLDQKPVLFLDRTFVPVRFLVEQGGGTVTWDHSNRSAMVEMTGLTCTNPVYCGK